MPIYGYACKGCEHTFDALQKMSEPVLVDCPECGEASLRKQLSAPKFRLKGKGWYETDFKTGDKKNLSGDSDGKDKSKTSDAKDGGATDGKSDNSKSDNSNSDNKADSKKTTTDNKSKSESA